MNVGEIVKYNGKIGKVVHGIMDYRFLPMNYGNYYECELEVIDETKLFPASRKEKIKFIESTFVWGRVIKTHVIGEYQIIEAEDDGEIYYYSYINYKNTGISYKSLDAAIIGAIGYKYEGGNGKAAGYFCKMLGM